MIDPAAFMHFAAIAFAVGINSISVGLAEGLISKSAIDAANIQPRAQATITRTAILGMALTETAAVFAVVIVILLTIISANTFSAGIAQLGIALAICLAGGVIGFVSHLPAKAACLAIARQPFFDNRITNVMLITLMLVQTPLIFSFIISFFIFAQINPTIDIANAVRLLSSGLCIGLGSMGPAIGLAVFAQSAVKALGINRHAYQKILSFTFLSEAIIETPIIFALLVSLLLISPATTASGSPSRVIALFAAALCTGLSTLGPGISSGRTAGAACNEIAYQPNLYGALSRTSMIAQGFLDTFAIYGLLIAIMLIFVIQ